MKTFEKRQKELTRQSQVTAVEAASISLQIGESNTFELMDILAWQRIRTRFNRLKPAYEFETEMDGNNLSVKRIA